MRNVGSKEMGLEDEGVDTEGRRDEMGEDVKMGTKEKGAERKQ